MVSSRVLWKQRRAITLSKQWTCSMKHRAADAPVLCCIAVKHQRCCHWGDRAVLFLTALRLCKSILTVAGPTAFGLAHTRSSSSRRTPTRISKKVLTSTRTKAHARESLAVAARVQELRALRTPWHDVLCRGGRNLCTTHMSDHANNFNVRCLAMLMGNPFS